MASRQKEREREAINKKHKITNVVNPDRGAWKFTKINFLRL
jgi:hypothetical protein